jgi:hypothetical protein
MSIARANTETPEGIGILSHLAGAWRGEAEGLRRRYGMDQLASLCEVHAAELEDALARSTGRLLTLREASAESGYSVAHLRVLLASGALTQAGRRGAPRVLSTDLPRKSVRREEGSRPVEDEPFDAAVAARSALALAP